MLDGAHASLYSGEMRLGRALVTFGLCASAACTDDASPYFGTTERRLRDTKTFQVNNAGEPEYLDPGMAHDTVSSVLAHHLFEGLTVYHPADLRPVQGGAIAWDQSADSTVFRFHLRPDARWSDGKTVSARDYEYAWRRVLRPRTASQAAPNLYVLLNAELFNRGKLKVLLDDITALREPRAGAAAAGKLEKGAPVRILARSPLTVAAAVAPLAAPVGKRLVSWSPADARARTPERITFGSEHDPVVASADGAWKGATVDVLALGPPIDCNGTAAHWLLVQRGSDKGWLPACALTEPRSSDGFVVVSRHARLPTYRPRATATPPPLGQAPETEAPAEALFVPARALGEDASVLGVRAVDELTLEVELERPAPYFTDLTSTTPMMPVRQDVVERFEARGETELWVRPENIVCNGPYILDEWKFRYEISVVRQPHYWNRDALQIHRAVFLAVEEANAALNLYKGGDIDSIGDNTSLPLEYMKFLRPKKDFHRYFFNSTYWYEFNTKKPPVDDVRVRHALNLAIDKQQLIDRVTRADQLPATHFVPDFVGLGYADRAAADKAAGKDPFAQFGFDPDKGRKLLGEAGYPVVREGDGWRAQGFPGLEILYNTGEGHKSIAIAIQDMWKRHLGVSASLRNEEWRVMLKNVRDGNFHVVRFAWVGDYNHPHTWLETFASQSPQNYTGWADGAFDALLASAAATSDPALSIERYRQAELRAVEGMPKMPLYFYTRSILVKPWVRGFVGNTRNIHIVKWFSIDPDWEKNVGKTDPSKEFAVVEPDFPSHGVIQPDGSVTPPPPPGGAAPPPASAAPSSPPAGP